MFKRKAGSQANNIKDLLIEDRHLLSGNCFQMAGYNNYHDGMMAVLLYSNKDRVGGIVLSSSGQFCSSLK